jgi:hypothetical protein
MPGRIKLDPMLSIVLPSVRGYGRSSYKTQAVFREELFYRVEGFDLVRKMLKGMMEHDDIPGAIDLVNSALEDADTLLELDVRGEIRIYADKRSKAELVKFKEQGAGSTANIQNPGIRGETKWVNPIRRKDGPESITNGPVNSGIGKDGM